MSRGDLFVSKVVMDDSTPFVLAIFLGVVGGIFSESCMPSRLEVLDGRRDSSASRDVSANLLWM